MTLALISDKTQNLLNKLQNDNRFTFYLTGSRFFGGASENSDWDFMVEENAGLDNFLKENNFSDIGYENYNDCSVLAVWFNATVHVQVLKEGTLRKKLKVQSMLKECEIMPILSSDKRLRSMLWNLLLSLVH